MEHPARVEEEREGGTGPRGRDRGGRDPREWRCGLQKVLSG